VSSSADRLDLHCRTWGTGKRVAVLIHGQVGDSRSWWQVAPALAELGYRVIAVDLPGHGHSPRSDKATHDQFVAALLRSVPARPALAIGHSLGGLVLASAESVLLPGRAVYVDIDFGPFTVLSEDDITRYTATLAESKSERTLSYLARERPWWSEQDRIVEARATELFDPGTSVSWRVSLGGAEMTPKPCCPSLMVRADPSQCVSPQLALQLEERGFTVRSIAGAGHSVWYGHFDEFLSALDGWI
jgi:pimeloyl-ACP methyl ester carboxylesterase